MYSAGLNPTVVMPFLATMLIAVNLLMLSVRHLDSVASFIGGGLGLEHLGGKITHVW